MPLQKDSVNCGNYTMYYIDCIGLNKPFNAEFEPDEYRKEVAEIMLKNRKDVMDDCQHSFVRNIKKTMSCIQCGRSSHKRCITKNYNTTTLRILINNEENQYACYICKMNNTNPFQI